MSKEVWSFCSPILDFEKDSLYELLDKIRQTRNDLAHFRKEISASSRDELRYCANWLGNRYQDYEKQQKPELIEELFKTQALPKSVHVIAEEQPRQFSSNAEEKKSTKRRNLEKSRYAALAIWLAQQKEEQVSLTFDQIEEIIRSRLPNSALQLRAWWSNDRVGHYQSILWLEAGWKVIYVDLNEKKVVFARLQIPIT